MHPADAAKLDDMPQLAKRFAVRFGSRLDLYFLEAVFAAVIARVTSCDSLGALLRDFRQNQVPSPTLRAASVEVERS